jgi:acyl-CoA thioesterase FadM
MVFTFSLRVLATIAKGLRQGQNIPTPIKSNQVMITKHRCWPTDIDFFFHMNNAIYFRHFELARWELLPRTGLLQHAMKENWMFLAVEQDAKYMKMIRPMQEFECHTCIHVSDGKWLDFQHSLVSTDGKTKYSEGVVRAVVKRRNGKTVRPNEFPDYVQEQLVDVLK